MNQPNEDIRQAFAKPLRVFLRVTPRGFLHGDELLECLQGRLRKLSLVRKRFKDGLLECHSTDGKLSRSGILCLECLHSQCRPWLRIDLANERATYVMDLAPTSAANLFLLEDEAMAEGQELFDWTLRLAVVERDYWGEVYFERVR